MRGTLSVWLYDSAPLGDGSESRFLFGAKQQALNGRPSSVLASRGSCNTGAGLGSCADVSQNAGTTTLARRVTAVGPDQFGWPVVERVSSFGLDRADPHPRALFRLAERA